MYMNELVLVMLLHLGTFYIVTPPFEEVGVYCFAHVGRSVGWSVRRQILSDQYLENTQARIFSHGMVVVHDQQMTPFEFGLSRSKVKVEVTFKLSGAYMFHKHFLLLYRLTWSFVQQCHYMHIFQLCYISPHIYQLIIFC